MRYELYQAFNYRINHVEIISVFKRKMILYVRVFLVIVHNLWLLLI